jgi:hypothetical protein
MFRPPAVAAHISSVRSVSDEYGGISDGIRCEPHNGLEHNRFNLDRYSRMMPGSNPGGNPGLSLIECQFECNIVIPGSALQAAPE